MNPKIIALISCVFLGMASLQTFSVGVVSKFEFYVVGILGLIALLCYLANFVAIIGSKLRGGRFPLNFLRKGFIIAASAHSLGYMALLVLISIKGLGFHVVMLISGIITLAPHWLQVAQIWLIPRPPEPAVSPTIEPPPEAVET